jgi:hypothetical protein
MKRSVISFLVLGALCLSGARAIPAADPTETLETRLREKLRDTMLQLRAAETDRAALQAAQAQTADENKALTEKLEGVTKEANANKLAAKAVESLKSQVARQDNDIAQLKEAAESCRQAAEVARKQAAEKEADRSKRETEVVSELERLVADRQQKNLELYRTGSEILRRYEQFGLGDAIKAREPFVGITRVKLESLIQDYQDKLLNERTTLKEKDLDPARDVLLFQPPQASTASSRAPGQTPE